MSSQPQRKNLTPLFELRERLVHTRYADRPKFARELDRLFGRGGHGGDFERRVESLRQSIESSVAQVERLQSQALRLEFDPVLPITAHREEIARAVQAHSVVVVCGATGSGKTTQLPKICIEAGRGAFGLIGHTQPRRMEARAIAQMLYQELGEKVG
jgi:ATP-dependent helicase HrpA